MLVNLTPYEPEIERVKKMIEEEPEIFKNYVLQSDPSKIIETGIYRSMFNFRHQEFVEFKDFHGNIPMDQSYNIFYKTWEDMANSGMKYMSTYGVADNVEQIKEYYVKEITDPVRKFIITVTPVFQDKGDDVKSGGWRWHKWGPYIGKLKPQMEYLDDEDFGDDFECVLCFSLYEVI